MPASHRTVAKAQRIRLTRLYMSMATYGVLICAVYVIQKLGLGVMPPWAFVLFVTYAVIVNATFFFLIRSGYNLGLKEPSLTLFQILASAIWAFLPIFYFHDARVICQMLCLPAVSFGMLKLDFIPYLKAVATLAAVYVSAVGADYLTGRTSFSLEIEIFQGLLFLLVLLWFALFGSLVSGVRQRQRAQNTALEQARALIEEQARTDELTSLYNRRYAGDVLKEERHKAARAASVFSVGMIDLDHFKDINDHYGHAAGDMVLQRFSELANRMLRSEDVLVHTPESPILARYGGEEFLLILPGTSEAQAWSCIERLRLSFRALEFPGFDAPVTFSAGVAEYLTEESVESLLKRVDDALYLAKGMGRDQVVSDSHTPELSTS